MSEFLYLYKFQVKPPKARLQATLRRNPCPVYPAAPRISRKFCGIKYVGVTIHPFFATTSESHLGNSHHENTNQTASLGRSDTPVQSLADWSVFNRRYPSAPDDLRICHCLRICGGASCFRVNRSTATSRAPPTPLPPLFFLLDFLLLLLEQPRPPATCSISSRVKTRMLNSWLSTNWCRRSV